MGLFSREPDRGLQKELAKQANGARNLLGYALLHKRTINIKVIPDNQAAYLTGSGSKQRRMRPVSAEWRAAPRGYLRRARLEVGL